MDMTNTVHGPDVEEPDRGFVIAAVAHARRHTPSGRRGRGAVVMYSLFEEQITAESFYLDYYLSHGTDSYAESLSYFPERCRLQRRPGRVPGADSAREAIGGHSGHRQPQRSLDGRLDRVRVAASKRRARTRWS